MSDVTVVLPTQRPGMSSKEIVVRPSDNIYQHLMQLLTTIGSGYGKNN